MRAQRFRPALQDLEAERLPALRASLTRTHKCTRARKDITAAKRPDGHTMTEWTQPRGGQVNHRTAVSDVPLPSSLRNFLEIKTNPDCGYLNPRRPSSINQNQNCLLNPLCVFTVTPQNSLLLFHSAPPALSTHPVIRRHHPSFRSSVVVPGGDHATPSRLRHGWGGIF